MDTRNPLRPKSCLVPVGIPVSLSHPDDNHQDGRESLAQIPRGFDGLGSSLNSWGGFNGLGYKLLFSERERASRIPEQCSNHTSAFC